MRRTGQALALTAGLLAGLMALGALAQAGLPVPAEAPPPDFAADRYVDSRGCSFIRARLGGTEAWVPLLAADRSQLCDGTPSVAAAPAPAAVPSPAPATAAARTVRAPRGAPDWSRGFVQVAAFAVPGNAARTEARLLQMGLPALQRPASAGGRLLHVVQIGPLEGDALRDALAAARAAGFGDAYVIR